MSRIQVVIEESEFHSIADAISTDEVDQLRFYPRTRGCNVSNTHRDLAIQVLNNRGVFPSGHGWHFSLLTHVDADASPDNPCPASYWLVMHNP